MFRCLHLEMMGAFLKFIVELFIYIYIYKSIEGFYSRARVQCQDHFCIHSASRIRTRIRSGGELRVRDWTWSTKMAGTANGRSD